MYVGRRIGVFGVSPKRGRGEGEGVVFSSLNSEVKKVECNAGP